MPRCVCARVCVCVREERSAVQERREGEGVRWMERSRSLWKKETELRKETGGRATSERERGRGGGWLVGWMDG